MLNYSFFQKNFFLSTLKDIFLNGKLVFFSNVVVSDTISFVALKKILFNFGLHFFFCNKALLQKKCFHFGRSLEVSSSLKGSILLIYSFDLNSYKLLNNILLTSQLSKLVLFFYLHKRFLFFNHAKYFLKQNVGFCFLKMVFALNGFTLRSLFFLLFRKKLFFLIE